MQHNTGEKKVKVVPCCINSSVYIEDTAQLSIITN